MRLEELFEQLSYGRLSNLDLGSDGLGRIPEDKYPKITNYINEALNKLHARFVLKENVLIIEQVENITNYHLKKRYALTTQSDVRHKYIIDNCGSPFEEDVIKVLSVFDSTGRARVLNDHESNESIFTPRPDTIQIPNPRAGEALTVNYQARHAKLDPENLEQEIDIPFFLETALFNYIGYLTYSDMNGQEQLVKAQELNAAYERECNDVEDKDLVSNTTTGNTKFENRGWR